jgi:hypothetical protein
VPTKEESSDDDSDGDVLEHKMMNALLKEKQTMKNWKAVILRVQMINSFKLSMRTIE